MTLKKQWKTIKENWLLVGLVLLLLFVNPLSTTTMTQSLGKASYDASYAMEEMAVGRAAMPYPSPGYGDDFAPDVEERQITKSASLTTEVEAGQFKTAESRLKDIVSQANAFLLNENVNKYDAKHPYYQGSYQIKVDTRDYDAMIAQLKLLGEVQSFNENMQDITAQFENAEINLATEKARLERYQQMYKEATRMEDKITLNDRIFNQERTIKYLEDRLENLDKRVSYSTVHVSLREEQSEYANVVFVKLSELVRAFVASLNGMVTLVVQLLPWAILIWLGRKLYKRK